MQTVLQFIFSFRFILINIGVFAYFAWAQPILLGVLQHSPNQPAIPAGLALMSMQILNLFAILYKAPFLQQRGAHSQGQNHSGVGFILVSLAGLCYSGLVSPLANRAILELLGIEIRGTPPFWQGLFGLLYLFAMLILNTWLMLASVFPFLGKIEIPQRLRLGEEYPMTVEWLADLVLAAFSVTAYTLGKTGRQHALYGHNPARRFHRILRRSRLLLHGLSGYQRTGPGRRLAGKAPHLGAPAFERHFHRHHAHRHQQHPARCTASLKSTHFSLCKPSFSKSIPCYAPTAPMIMLAFLYRTL